MSSTGIDGKTKVSGFFWNVYRHAHPINTDTTQLDCLSRRSLDATDVGGISMIARKRGGCKSSQDPVTADSDGSRYLIHIDRTMSLNETLIDDIGQLGA